MQKRGFTLLELLTVIFIIGVLAAIVTVGITAARKKARDSKRISDLSSIQTAIELYYDASPTHTYPLSSAITSCVAGGYCAVAFSDSGSNWIPAPTPPLIPTYLSVLPKDPLNNTTYRYGYRTNTSGTDYKLIATNMESSEGESKAKDDGGTQNTCPAVGGGGQCWYELFSPGGQVFTF